MLILVGNATDPIPVDPRELVGEQLPDHRLEVDAGDAPVTLEQLLVVLQHCLVLRSPEGASFDFYLAAGEAGFEIEWEPRPGAFEVVEVTPDGSVLLEVGGPRWWRVDVQGHPDGVDRFKVSARAGQIVLQHFDGETIRPWVGRGRPRID